MVSKTLFSKATDEWATPQALFDELNKEFNFTFDAAASADNHKCRAWSSDSLDQEWIGETVWLNPPYSKIKEFAKKAYEESRNEETTVVMLIPARTDTRYFHDWIYHKAELRFIKGRLKFGEAKNSAPFPSMLCIYKGENNDRNCK